MSGKPKDGEFCWNELASSDVKRSASFYEKLLGWKSTTVPMGDGQSYTLFEQGGEQVGGLRALSPEEKGVPSHWMSYILVDNVDAVCEKASTLGGQVVAPPMEIPGIGRFGFIQDPTGAVFALWKNLKG